jgi:hypothetical protein
MDHQRSTAPSTKTTMPEIVTWGRSQGIAAPVQTAARTRATSTPPPVTILITTSDPRSSWRAEGSRRERRARRMVSGTRERTTTLTKAMV